MNFRIKPRFAKNVMNKTEERYGAILEIMKRAGEIVDYHFEAVTFKLAPDLRYTPDFMVVYQDYIELVEIKGFMRDDALVKFKTAAEKFPYFVWKMMRYKNKAIGWETIREI